MDTPIPTPVSELLDASNAGDTERFLKSFTDDGFVDDWGRVFSGHEGIRSWSDAEFIGKSVTLQVTNVTTNADTTIVSAEVGGSGFNGPSTFTFVAADDGVRSMSITA